MYPNLRIQLWKVGIRQNRLARMLDMDETLLSRIVNGYRQPTPEFRKKIAELLQSDEAWLFEEVENTSLTDSAGVNTKPAAEHP
jgi:transcriptional regulator with XRE-family HTH domain